MASKKELKELKAQIAGLEFERDVAKRDAEFAWNQIKTRDKREHDVKQAELKRQEREARRQHLNDLDEGRFDVKNASASAIVREDGGAYVELSFPLDEQELKIVQG